MKPTFSIIIPAHNEEKYIQKTLNSIKKLNYEDFETIVVANGCADKTEEIVKKNQEDKNADANLRVNLRLLSLAKPNVSVARNAGALNAKGEILVFLDADTSLEEDALQKIKEEFTEEYAIAATKVKPDEEQLKYRLAMQFKNFYNSTGIYKGCSGALICRKEDFNKIKGYEPEISVKEHRKLTIKLKPFGKYRCIDTYVITSMRRFNRWGLGKATIFWLQQWAKAWAGDLKSTDYERIR